MKKFVIFVLIAAALAGGGWYWWTRSHKEIQRSYKTAKIERGRVIQTVKASGTVSPVRLVQVGTQVNGPVKKLLADYNDHVKAGQIVAQIDPTVYQASYAQSQANLAQAMASLEQAKAKLSQADKDLARSQELAKRELLSASDLDAAVANRDSLAALVKVSEATIEQTTAAIQVTKANLDYTTIHSPVDGVVIARNVDEGQTVVASLSAQTLFSVATDLHHVQILASIPEADIGQIRVGQPVTFNVDAFEQDFTGTVSQIRLSAANVQNVITYPVVINAENPDERLYPTMTANISCEVGRHDDALRVPNAALRFKPDDADVAAEHTDHSDHAGHSGGGGPGGGGGGSAQRQKNKVWVLDPQTQKPKSVPVRLGLTDGVNTEIREPSKLDTNTELIIGYNEDSAGPAQTVNPFAPNFGSRRGR